MRNPSPQETPSDRTLGSRIVKITGGNLRTWPGFVEATTEDFEISELRRAPNWDLIDHVVNLYFTERGYKELCPPSHGTYGFQKGEKVANVCLMPPKRSQTLRGTIETF